MADVFDIKMRKLKTCIAFVVDLGIQLLERTETSLYMTSTPLTFRDSKGMISSVNKILLLIFIFLSARKRSNAQLNQVATENLDL